MRQRSKASPAPAKPARSRVAVSPGRRPKRRLTVGGILRNTELQSLDGEILMGSVLGRSRSWLLAHPETPVSPADSRRFDVLAARRGTGEPIAYLTGRKEFYGREFAVTEDVLCPRPDTEALVERVLPVLAPNDVLFDIGTGSGCVGITIAAERPDVSVVLADVSAAALRVARRNARRLRIRVRTVRTEYLPKEALKIEPARLVLAGNLPYLDASDVPPPFEPTLAFDGGPDGLSVIRTFVSQLREQGVSPRHLLLEHGQSQGRAVRGLIGPRARTTVDLAGHDRVTGY